MNTDFSQPFNPEAYAPSAKTDTRFRCCVEKGMPWLYGIIFPVILGLCLYTYEKETLFRIQELNSSSGQYFLSYTRGISGRHIAMGILFPHPVLLLSGCGDSLSRSRLDLHLLRHALGLPAVPSWSFLPALVPAALLAGIVEMGYFIYYIKLQGYFFTASLGILAALSAVWVFSRTAHRRPYWVMRG